MQAEKKIIWGFPGCGKSFLADGKRIVDADCRLFKFAGVNEELLHGGFGGLAERNLDYPGNYLEYVRTCSADVVLVNCHLGLLSEFPGVEIVYPAKELKGEYLDRYRKRGDDESFVAYMDEVFEQMVELIEGMEGVQKYRMEDPRMYLSDIMNNSLILTDICKENRKDMFSKERFPFRKKHEKKPSLDQQDSLVYGGSVRVKGKIPNYRLEKVPENFIEQVKNEYKTKEHIRSSLDSKIQHAAKVCEKMSKDKGVVGKETEKEFGR